MNGPELLAAYEHRVSAAIMSQAMYLRLTEDELIDPACDLIVTAAEVELERGDQPVACSVVRGLDRNVISFVPLPPLTE